MSIRQSTERNFRRTFLPATKKVFSKLRSAVLLFHGGGWSAGEPEWVLGRAKTFAARGLVAATRAGAIIQGSYAIRGNPDKPVLVVMA